MDDLMNATFDSGRGTMMFSNMTSTNATYSRADLVATNDEIARALIPAMVVIGVMIVLGVLGNSLVCFIFCFRLRPSTQNYLIVYLAVFDLLSSTIGMPSEIADMRYMLIFESEAGCRIMRFANTFCTNGSVLTLVVIAVDRFRKVCRPLQGQLTVKHVKYCLFPILGGALFFAWPACVIYGLSTVDSGVPGFNGSDCSTADAVRHTAFPLLYNGVLLLAFVVISTSLLIIYCRVLSETKRHVRYMKRNSDFNLTHSHSDHHEDSTGAGHHVHSHTVSTHSSHSSDDKEHNSTGTAQTSLGQEPEPEPEVFINRAYSDNTLDTKVSGETSESSFKDTLQQASIQEMELMGKEMQDGDTKKEETKIKKKLAFQMDSGTEIAQKNDITGKQPSGTDNHIEEVDSNFKQTSFLEENSGKYQSSETTELKMSYGDTSVLKGDNCEQTNTVDFAHTVNLPAQTETFLALSESRLCELPLFHPEASDEVTPHFPTATSNDVEIDVSTTSQNPRSSISSAGVYCISPKTTPSCEKPKKDRAQRFQSKTTMIAFLITLVFILSFVPHLSLQISRMIFKGFDYDLDDAGLVFFNLFLRSYFLNSILNPFIYGILNVKFREEVKKLVKQFKSLFKRRKFIIKT